MIHRLTDWRLVDFVGLGGLFSDIVDTCGAWLSVFLVSLDEEMGRRVPLTEGRSLGFVEGGVTHLRVFERFGLQTFIFLNHSKKFNL